MQYLHTMIRVTDINTSLRFYCDGLGLEEVRRYDSEAGRFTLVFLAAPEDLEAATINKAPLIELTYNWDPEEYTGGRNFGHLAYRVDDIYALCSHLKESGSNDQSPTTRWIYGVCSEAPMVFLLNSCNLVTRSHPQNLGHQCQTQALGKTC